MLMNANESVVDVEGDRVTTEKLMADLRIVAGDMEQLLNASAGQTGRHLAQVRTKAKESLKAAASRAAVIQDAALAKTRATGRATDDYVRANPWQVLAFGAVTGVVIGALLARGASANS
jgi:ElaB/YqjD/DUF883 family membrane-anchored ribosome-binding protein